MADRREVACDDLREVAREVRVLRQPGLSACDLEQRHHDARQLVPGVDVLREQRAELFQELGEGRSGLRHGDDEPAQVVEHLLLGPRLREDVHRLGDGLGHLDLCRACRLGSDRRVGAPGGQRRELPGLPLLDEIPDRLDHLRQLLDQSAYDLDRTDVPRDSTLEHRVELVQLLHLVDPGDGFRLVELGEQCGVLVAQALDGLVHEGHLRVRWGGRWGEEVLGLRHHVEGVGGRRGWRCRPGGHRRLEQVAQDHGGIGAGHRDGRHGDRLSAQAPTAHTCEPLREFVHGVADGGGLRLAGALHHQRHHERLHVTALDRLLLYPVEGLGHALAVFERQGFHPLDPADEGLHDGVHCGVATSGQSWGSREVP